MAYVLLKKQGEIQCRIGYQVEQDVAENQSRIRLTSFEMTASKGLGACWVVGQVTVNGQKLWGYSTWYSQIMLATGWNKAGHCPEGAVPVTVTHDEEGNAKVTFRVSVNFTTSASELPYSSSAAVDLQTIPRTTELTAEAVPLGSTMTILLNRKSEAFSDTLTFSCGGITGEIAQDTQQSQILWQVPLALASQEPEDNTVQVQLRVQTRLGDTVIGSRGLILHCPIPEWVRPEVQVTVEDATGYDAAYGGFVQQRSRARVLTQAEGMLGANIQNVAVTVGSLRGAGSEAVFALPDSGQVPVHVTVTDSRGRSTAVHQQISVLPYGRPWIGIRDIRRCDAAGVDAPEGAFVRVAFQAAVTPLNGRNPSSFGIQSREHGQTEWISQNLTDYFGIYSLEDGSCQIAADPDKSYDCRMWVRDGFEKVYCGTERVLAAFALMDFDRDGKAVGIGLRAGEANTLSVGLDMKLFGHRIGDLAQPEQAGDAATKEYVDSLLARLAQRLGIEWEET